MSVRNNYIILPFILKRDIENKAQIDRWCQLNNNSLQHFYSKLTSAQQSHKLWVQLPASITCTRMEYKK
jgi:hypothetical protein